MRDDALHSARGAGPVPVQRGAGGHLELRRGAGGHAHRGAALGQAHQRPARVQQLEGRQVQCGPVEEDRQSSAIPLEEGVDASSVSSLQVGSNSKSCEYEIT